MKLQKIISEYNINDGLLGGYSRESLNRMIVDAETQKDMVLFNSLDASDYVKVLLVDNGTHRIYICVSRMSNDIYAYAIFEHVKKNIWQARNVKTFLTGGRNYFTSVQITGRKRYMDNQ